MVPPIIASKSLGPKTPFESSVEEILCHVKIQMIHKLLTKYPQEDAEKTERRRTQKQKRKQELTETEKKRRSLRYELQGHMFLNDLHPIVSNGKDAIDCYSCRFHANLMGLDLGNWECPKAVYINKAEGTSVLCKPMCSKCARLYCEARAWGEIKNRIAAFRPVLPTDDRDRCTAWLTKYEHEECKDPERLARFPHQIDIAGKPVVPNKIRVIKYKRCKKSSRFFGMCAQHVAKKDGIRVAQVRALLLYEAPPTPIIHLNRIICAYFEEGETLFFPC